MHDGTHEDPPAVGDRVRVDVPEEVHPAHKHHGHNGEVIAVIPPPPGTDPKSYWHTRYRVALDTGGTVDVGPHHLRPPI